MTTAFLMATALAVAVPANAQTPPAALTAPAPTARAVLIKAAPAPGPIVWTARRKVPLHPRHRPLSRAELHVRSANHLATLEPGPAGALEAQQVYPFSDGAIYHVLTAPGEVTDIALQPGEKLGAVAAGDTVRWVIGDTSSGSGDAKRSHVLVKPFAAGLATNIVITTDRRTYHLALTSTPRIAMSALSWVYPQDQLIALKAAADPAEAARPVATGLRIEQLNFNYAISGMAPAWRPLRAFDDGRQTFIEFPASISVGEAPPLFLVDSKGGASLVNYRVLGRYYVVDRIFDVAELRLGLKHQDIVRITRTGEVIPVRRAS